MSECALCVVCRAPEAWGQSLFASSVLNFHLVMWFAIGTWWMTIESPVPLLSQLVMVGILRK